MSLQSKLRAVGLGLAIGGAYATERGINARETIEAQIRSSGQVSQMQIANLQKIYVKKQIPINHLAYALAHGYQTPAMREISALKKDIASDVALIDDFMITYVAGLFLIGVSVFPSKKEANVIRAHYKERGHNL